MSSLRSGTKRKGRGVNVKQISAPIATTDPTGPRPVVDVVPLQKPRPPLQGGDKTGDLVKRRYSTRFNNIPTDFHATAPPPVPALPPVQFSKYEPPQERPPPPSRGVGAAPLVDGRALRDPKLKADEYVAKLLGEATADQIEEYGRSLGNCKVEMNAELQRTLTQNRTLFIKISKEAGKLKDELRSLRNLIAELKINTTALRSASVHKAGTGDGDADGPLSMGMGTSKRDKRSSVADRSALWNSQMQALYKNVEGSQKFLPGAAGRHVIQNAGPWIELDNATYKSRRAMQIFLLNDHLLVASRKKRKAEGSGAADPRGPVLKLVADRCWPLLDIEIVDMTGSKDSSGAGARNKLADSIMVRGVGQESFLYRTEKADDPAKGSLLMNVRKAVEELRKGLQSEMDASNKAKETLNYFASRDPGLLHKTELLETLSDIKDMLIEVDGNQQNLRWVEAQMDELDIHIARQHFDDAVRLVEKMKGLAGGLKNNPVAQDFIDFKVDERCARLATLILREMELRHNERSKTKMHVDWLTKLGYEDRAREAYLGARRDTIQKRLRQCIFKGDLHDYIWQISYVYFALIHNTVQTFQLCFPQTMMSTCVGWARREVEDFNAILARQLSGTERGSSEWTRCTDRAREHAGKLGEVGLDFQGLVGRDGKPAAGIAVPEEPVGLGFS